MPSENADVSNNWTVALASKRASPASLKSIIHDKGWTMRDAADYLEVSRQRLYSALANKQRPRFWDISIQNLPICTQAIKNELALERAGRKRKRPKKSKPSGASDSGNHQVEVDDCVVAISYAGIAEEGDQGWVTSVRGAGASREIEVQMPDGRRWFSLAEFDDYFQTTGLTRGLGI